MSTIDEIREQSKAVWAVNAITPTKSATDAGDDFEKILEQMKTGKPAGGGDKSDAQTRTVTEVLSDGSVLITVWEGTKIVSQTKTHATEEQAAPAVLSVRSEAGAADQLAATQSSASTLSGAAGLLALLQ